MKTLTRLLPGALVLLTVGLILWIAVAVVVGSQAPTVWTQ